MAVCPYRLQWQRKPCIKGEEYLRNEAWTNEETHTFNDGSLCKFVGSVQ